MIFLPVWIDYALGTQQMRRLGLILSGPAGYAVASIFDYDMAIPKEFNDASNGQ